MKQGLILSGLFFVLTSLYIALTYQYFPKIISSQVTIGQLFTQSTSLEWERTSFLQFFIGVFLIMNILLHGLLPMLAQKSKKRKSIEKQKLRVVYAYSGAYVNLVLLLAYMATAELNGINVLIPYFLLITILIVTSIAFVVWVFKYIMGSSTHS